MDYNPKILYVYTSIVHVFTLIFGGWIWKILRDF
jgi:hypothetical protein